MRPSDARSRAWKGRRLLVFVAVGNVVLGLAVAGLGAAFLVSTEDGVPGWVGALALVGGAVWAAVLGVGFGRTYLRVEPLDGRRVSVEAVDGRQVTVLRWVRTALAGPTVAVTFLVVLLLGLALALTVGGAILPWLPLVVALPLAILLPDSWARMRRHPALILDERGITVLGWDGQGSMTWDDVEGLTVVDAGTWDVLRVVAKPGAASYTWTPRRRFLLTVRPVGQSLDIPVPALDVPHLFLAGTVMHYAQTPSARHETADGTARRRLVEQARPV
ncbi:hypothetical protein [Cellulomonas soli]